MTTATPRARKPGRRGKSGQDRILVRPIGLIRPSPENARLYRPVDPNDPKIVALAESIRQHGIQEPLLVTRDGWIVSGHRRRVTAGLAGLGAPCRMLPKMPARPERFLGLLREHNRQRVKSREEMLRETIIDVKPEDAYRQLNAYRTRKPRRQGGKAVKIIGTKTRAKITAAKTPSTAWSNGDSHNAAKTRRAALVRPPESVIRPPRHSQARR